MAFRAPNTVVVKNVPDDTTYDDVLTWWLTHEEAENARSAVRESAVCFIQLGGHDKVFISVPDATAPEGVRSSVQSTSRQRGRQGTATMLVYT